MHSPVNPQGTGDCGIHRVWRLGLLCVHSEEKRVGDWPLPFMAVWELETLKLIILKKLFIFPRKLVRLQIHTAQVRGETRLFKSRANAGPN